MSVQDYLDIDAVVACAALVGRSGGKAFEVGFLEDGYVEGTVPIEKARWYAQASYMGARLIADEKAGPDEAADALARRILAGGRCTNCGFTVAIGKQHQSKRCTWYRDGPVWVRGCDGKRQLTEDQ